jgi:hypothetical protein
VAGWVNRLGDRVTEAAQARRLGCDRPGSDKFRGANWGNGRRIFQRVISVLFMPSLEFFTVYNVVVGFE